MTPTSAPTNPATPGTDTSSGYAPRRHPRHMTRRRIAAIYASAILAGVLVALLLSVGIAWASGASRDTKAADFYYWQHAVGQSTARCVANYDQIQAIAQWLLAKPRQIDFDDKAVMATAWANCLSVVLPSIPSSLRDDKDMNTAQMYAMRSNMYGSDAAFALKQVSEGWPRPRAKEEAQTAIGLAITDYHLYQKTIETLAKHYAS